MRHFTEQAATLEAITAALKKLAQKSPPLVVFIQSEDEDTEPHRWSVTANGKARVLG